jgi:tRNA(Glu) U13 pseudouridine synthase TruD
MSLAGAGMWRELLCDERLLKIKLLCNRLAPNTSVGVPNTNQSGATAATSLAERRSSQAVLQRLQAKSRRATAISFDKIKKSNDSARLADLKVNTTATLACNIPAKSRDKTLPIIAHSETRSSSAQEPKDDEEELFLAPSAHPRHLFHDEPSVLRNFGMGCFLSPDAPGFDAIFRQRWQDFHVTEMAISEEPLTRLRDYSSPPLPDWLARHFDNDVLGANGDIDDHAPPPDSFFSVNVEQQLSRNNIWGGPDDNNAVTPKPSDADQSLLPSTNKLFPDRRARSVSGEYYLQATLHKQHIAHPVAMSMISKTLRIHPQAISFAGIKDFIGDTVQRIRLKNVPPGAVLAANKMWQENRRGSSFPDAGDPMSLSNFSYETEPLRPGQLFGNHFKIILRDVTAPKDVVDSAMKSFAENGFPNYYGCQRFSWFGGVHEDAAVAVLARNWLCFAFRFLNFTDHPMTLRQLLQRDRKFPHAIQDHYRKRVVMRLRNLSILPTDLDVPPFLVCPSLFNADLSQYEKSTRIQLVLGVLEEAFFDLATDSRRMIAQRLGSYLWNQVLSLRLHYFGGGEVLVGDLVVPKDHHRLSCDMRAAEKEERKLTGVTESSSVPIPSSLDVLTMVTEENLHQFTIEDVVHPGFSFDGRRLPRNHVSDFYHDVCEKYHLDWNFKPSKENIPDFFEPPRPIVRRPTGFTYTYVAEDVIEVQFALEKGCYANVAVTELLKLSRCSGHETVTMLPLPFSRWYVGRKEPTYVTTMQDVYEDFEEGVGFVNEHEGGNPAPPPLSKEEEERRDHASVFDFEGPLFKAKRDDPFVKAARWSTHNLVKAVRRRDLDNKEAARQLFEPSLANTLLEGEIAQYAGHTVPMSPNTKGKRLFFKVLSRKQRYQGCPRFHPRVKRGADVRSGSKSKVPFMSLNKKAWNFVL